MHKKVNPLKKVQKIGRLIVWISSFSIFCHIITCLVGILIFLFFKNLGLEANDSLTVTNNANKSVLTTTVSHIESFDEIIFTHTIFVYAVNIIISIALLIIGISWTQANIFSRHVIQSCKWMGIILVLSKIHLSFMSWFCSNILDMNSSVLSYEFQTEGIIIGLTLISLSYIFQYSNQLEEESLLTV